MSNPAKELRPAPTKEKWNNPRGTPQERFWRKVKKTKSCWLWIGNRNADGVARFFYNDRVECASRVSWLFKHGAIDEGLCILHKCDNPTCVRPSHLFIGTPKDNMIDAVKKGRNPICKFTIAGVRRVRDRYKRGWSVQKLADHYGVAHQTISHIVRRVNWKHVK